MGCSLGVRAFDPWPCIWPNPSKSYILRYRSLSYACTAVNPRVLRLKRLDQAQFGRLIFLSEAQLPNLPLRSAAGRDGGWEQGADTMSIPANQCDGSKSRASLVVYGYASLDDIALFAEATRIIRDPSGKLTAVIAAVKYSIGLGSRPHK